MAHVIFALDSGLHLQATTNGMAELGYSRDSRGPPRHFFGIGHLAWRRLVFRYLGFAAWRLHGELGLLPAVPEEISCNHRRWEKWVVARCSSVLHFQPGVFCVYLFQGE